MCRQRRFDADRVASGIERQHQRSGVQHERRVMRGAPVQRIATDRPAGKGAMHPQLMRAPGDGTKLHERARIALLQNLPARLCRLGARAQAFRISDDAPGRERIDGRNRAIDDTVLIGGDRIEPGMVDLGDAALGEEPVQPAQGLGVASEGEAAGGVAVETVDDLRAGG